MDDRYYMQRCIELARKGAGFVNPNPMVGAVIVKDGEIIGEGYHEKFGENHAERNALKNCKKSPNGATLYVTLEPCCHYGKTPPCTEAIIENKIAKVVIGTLDINPLVAGKGARILKDNGINVTVGILEAECRKLNKIFNKYMSTKRPYVLMKYAMTSDGKIATKNGESKWISGECARSIVHDYRNNLSGIMVGVNTILVDNPNLNARKSPFINPVRIICDTYLRTPLDSKVVTTASEIPTIIATSIGDDRCKDYEKFGCKILEIPKNGDDIDLRILMQQLGQMGIDSILLEGGATLNYSALSEKIVDEIDIFMAPKIFGGNGKSPVEGAGIEHIADEIKLRTIEVSKVGEDILVESEVVY